MPTPGHTAGHQSLVVETGDGNVVLIGQAVPSASDYALMAYHAQLDNEGDGKHPPLPEWWPRIAGAAPVEVRFAHDLAIWRPDWAPHPAELEQPDPGSRSSISPHSRPRIA